MEVSAAELERLQQLAAAQSYKASVPADIVKKLDALLMAHAAGGQEVPNTVRFTDPVTGAKRLEYATVDALRTAVDFIKDNQHKPEYRAFFAQQGITDGDAEAAAQAQLYNQYHYGSYHHQQQQYQQQQQQQQQQAAPLEPESRKRRAAKNVAELVAAEKAGYMFDDEGRPKTGRGRKKNMDEDYGPPAGGGGAAAAAGAAGHAPGSDGEGGRANGADGGPGEGPGPSGRKRVVKTPFMLTALEQSFEECENPTEAERRALGARIGLEYGQINSWFTARRRKKKEALEAAGLGEEATPGTAGRATAPKARKTAKTPLDRVAEQRRREEEREVVRLAAAALPEPFREDGPPLALHFDPIPGPGGRGAQEDTDSDVETVKSEPGMDPLERARLKAEREAAKARRLEERARRERDKEKRREEKELSLRDKILLKEAERARKLQEKEAKKEEAAKAKLEKRAAAETEKEEKRRQREAERALRQREGGARAGLEDSELEWADLIAKWRAEGLIPAAPAPAAAAAAAGEPQGTPQPAAQPQPEPDLTEDALAARGLTRPPFPPPDVKLVPAFPPVSDPASQGVDMSDVLMAWKFIHDFPELLGVPAFTPDELLAALAQGETSRLLADVHVSLIRLILADADEAYAAGSLQSQAGHAGDRMAHLTAQLVEVAWAWGYDLDTWRGDLDFMTWPEVLRQLGVVLGHGRRRMNLFKHEPYTGGNLFGDRRVGAPGEGGRGRRPADPNAGPRHQMGSENEDVEGYNEDGSIRLKMPSRISLGTLKGAAWTVLAEAGPRGLSTNDIAKKMLERGLRDLSHTKMPGTCVASGLMNDSLFLKIAPAVYALSSLVSHHKERFGEDVVDAGAIAATGRGGDDKKLVVEVEYLPPKDEPNMEAAAWVTALESQEYSELSLASRVKALAAVVSAAVELPSVRASLDSRLDEGQRLRRHLADEARRDKRRRQEDVAARASMLATRAMESYKAAQMRRAQGKAGVAGGGAGAAGAATASAAPAAGGAGGEDAAAAAAEDGAAQAASEAAAAAAAAKAAAAKEVDGGEDGAGGQAANPDEASVEKILTLGSLPDGNLPEDLRHLARLIEPSWDSTGQESAARAALRIEHELAVDRATCLRGEPLGLDRRHRRYWRFTAGAEGMPDPSRNRILVEDGPGKWLMLAGEADVARLCDALSRRGYRESELLPGMRAALERMASGAVAEPIVPPPEDAPLPQPDDEEAEWLDSLDLFADPFCGGRGSVRGSFSLEEDEKAGAAGAAGPSGKGGSGKGGGKGSRGKKAVKVEEEAEAEGEAMDVDGEDKPEPEPVPAWPELRAAKIKRDLLAIMAALPPEAFSVPREEVGKLARRVRAAADPLELRNCTAVLEAFIADSFVHWDFQTVCRAPQLVAGAFPNSKKALLRAAWGKRKGITREGVFAEAGVVPLPVLMGHIPPYLLPAKEGGAACDQIQPEIPYLPDMPPEKRAREAERLLAWLPPTTAAVSLRVRGLDSALSYRPGIRAARDLSETHNFIRRPVTTVHLADADWDNDRPPPRRAPTHWTFRKRALDRKGNKEEMEQAAAAAAAAAANAAARANAPAVATPALPILSLGAALPPGLNPPPGVPPPPAAFPGGRPGPKGKPTTGPIPGMFNRIFPQPPADLATRPEIGFYLPVADFKRYLPKQSDDPAENKRLREAEVQLLASLAPEGVVTKKPRKRKAAGEAGEGGEPKKKGRKPGPQKQGQARLAPAAAASGAPSGAASAAAGPAPVTRIAPGRTTPLDVDSEFDDDIEAAAEARGEEDGDDVMISSDEDEPAPKGKAAKAPAAPPEASGRRTRGVKNDLAVLAVLDGLEESDLD